MKTTSVKELIEAKCMPCEGGVKPFSAAGAKAQVKLLVGWRLVRDNARIRKEWTVKDFMAGVDFFNKVAEVAEADNHHPDLHLESYRNVSIELWTHAIGGLSINDFILAAKIDQLSIQLKLDS